MADSHSKIRFLIFDIESVADPNLIAMARYPGEGLTPAEALQRYRNELMEKKGTDFIPYTYQLPISLVLAKVADDYTLLDLRVLKVEDGGPKKITERFWEGWKFYQQPTFVTFNGRGFDIPLMELTAFRYGIPIPEWIAIGQKAYDQPRNRYNIRHHFDLCDFLSNCGAVHVSGGLNTTAKMIRKAGKIGTHGDMVQDMFNAGELEKIHQYCQCDVLDTYFIFLRTMVVSGRITLRQETELIQQTMKKLETESVREPVFKIYLDACKQIDAASLGNDDLFDLSRSGQLQLSPNIDKETSGKTEDVEKSMDNTLKNTGPADSLTKLPETARTTLLTKNPLTDNLFPYEPVSATNISETGQTPNGRSPETNTILQTEVPYAASVLPETSTSEKPSGIK
ncbi:MAG: 3'-5' exonuclease, partial [Thermoguttaceae bacterium]|nr:3'-5' exonuclease [Thermoguttaceae bacterium]